MISVTEIQKAINALGLSGSAVCIHSSMRSFGSALEGGLDGLLQSFLGSGCTVMVPTFSYMFEASPVPPYMPPRNGAGDYSCFSSDSCQPHEPYQPDSKELSTEDMGLFSEYVLQQPGSIRGRNPLNSFTALGPAAASLISGQTTRDVYAPFRELCDMNGYVLLMGVSLESATIIHCAEQVAGRTPFIRWAKASNGQTIPVSTGSCSLGFDHLQPVVSSIVHQVTVGQSVWSCYPAKEIVRLCAEALKKDPLLSHCGNANCDRCHDAVLGGPILPIDFWDKEE